MTAILASLLPNGKQTFYDSNGVPLVGGSVYFYIPSTSTPKNTWQDSGELVLNSTPVILDSLGSAVIYGSGVYRQLVKDSLGNTIWDQLTTGSPTSGTYLNVITQFGAIGDGVADDTVAIQAGLDYLNATGGCLYFPTGLYRITSALSETFTYSTDRSVTRPSIKGDGSGNSQILWDGGNTPTVFMMTLQRTDSSDGKGLHAHSVIEGIGFAPINSGKNQYVMGLKLLKWAYVHVRDVWVSFLNHGLQLDQVISSEFDSIIATNNNYGIWSVGAPTSTSSAVYNNNANTFISCEIGANLQGGMYYVDGSFIMVGGAVEGNGHSGSAGSGFGISIANLSTSGSVAMKLDGVYFEANGTTGDPGANASTADILILHEDPLNNLTYSINDCLFNRLVANYAPYSVLINRTVPTAFVLNTVGNNFQDYGGYSPSANRPYVSIVYNSGLGVAITGITAANPAVVTSAAHGFVVGNVVNITGVVGMTQVNARNFLISVATTNTYTLSGVNSSGYTAYSSGGVASVVSGITVNDAGNFYNQPTELPAYTLPVGKAYYQGLNYRPGALVYPSGAQSIPNTTVTAITWSTAAYNFYGIWEGVNNPTFLTVPANVGYVRITGNIEFAPTSTDSSPFLVSINKNGVTTFEGRPKVTLQAGVTSEIYAFNVCTPILAVAVGDYFEMVVSQTTGGSLNTGATFYDQWFSMELIG